MPGRAAAAASMPGCVCLQQLCKQVGSLTAAAVLLCLPLVASMIDCFGSCDGGVKYQHFVCLPCMLVNGIIRTSAYIHANRLCAHVNACAGCKLTQSAWAGSPAALKTLLRTQH